jgi:hypothetical protein
VTVVPEGAWCGKLTLPFCCNVWLDLQQKTPLHLAVSNSHEAVARVLVQGGANVRAKDMHVCLYSCVNVCMHVSMCACMNVCTHVCTHATRYQVK